MLLDLVKKRRSIRKYADRPIPKEDILKCIEAARLAPSACNGQPCRFIVVDEPLLKNRISERAFSGAYSINSFAKNAAALIVVISKRETFLRAMGSYFRGIKYYLLDTGIACEHLILQATELGIGSCWIGWFNERRVKEILNIPRNNKVDIIISLGYNQGDESAPKPRKSLEEISSFNSYNN